LGVLRRNAPVTAAHLESGRLRIINTPMGQELIAELNSFEVDFTSAGNMRVDVRSNLSLRSVGAFRPVRRDRCIEIIGVLVAEGPGLAPESVGTRFGSFR
jgi:hypothetical protein